MSQKRKLDEYRDPDYPQDGSEKKSRLSAEPDEKLSKNELICDIINREFDEEMHNKEQEVYEINNRISIVKKMLRKVSFAVISNYYNKRNLMLPPDEVSQAQESISRLFTAEPNGPQNALHPSLKKILGTNEVDYKELLNSRPTRQAAKTAQSTIKEKFKTKKEMRIERLRTKALELVQENITVDESSNLTTIVKETLDDRLGDDPYKMQEELLSMPSRWNKVQKLNTDRGTNLAKQLIAVGNTSKFIQKESTLDKVTHKWMIYVQSKTDVPIEKFVKKTRFYLHPSYKPNDIVDVEFPPFQLARRGWGEFPVRIQLFFHAKFQQKPVQLYHNLVLDKTLSGLQTLGSETLVEIWLRQILFSPQTAKSTETSNKLLEQTSNTKDVEKIKSEKLFSPLEESNDNFIDFLNNMDNCLPTDLDSIEPTLILSPTTHKKLKLSEAISSPVNQNHPLPVSCSIKSEVNDEVRIKTEPGVADNQADHSEPFKYNVESSDKLQMNLSNNIKQINEKLRETIKTEEDQQSTYKISEGNKNSRAEAPYIKLEPKPNTYPSLLNKNQSILKDGNISVLDPLQARLKKKRKRISLLKPVIKSQQILNSEKKMKFEAPGLIDHDYTSPWKDQVEVVKYSFGDVKNSSIMSKVTNDTEENKPPNETENSDLITSKDFISVVISDDTKQLINLKKKITLTVKEESYLNDVFIDYRGNFEIKFHSQLFATENDLIEFCLKNVPLINSIASEKNYKVAFPFVVSSLDALKILPLPKRRALEWLQCKYFSTLMKNHGKFNQTLWTTKEIVLYARAYGFSPIPLLHNVSHTKNTSNSDDDPIDYKSNLLMFQSVDQVNDWIKTFNTQLENSFDIDKIDVDYSEDECKHDDKLKSKKSSPIKSDPKSLIIAVDQKYEEESKLVKEICKQIDIFFKPEDVAEDARINVSELILIKVFRKFLESLIRNSIFEVKKTNEFQSIPVIQIEHVKQAVLSNPDFEFLASKMYKTISEIKKETNQ